MDLLVAIDRQVSPRASYPAYLFLVSAADSKVFCRRSSSKRRCVDCVSAGVGRATEIGGVMPQVCSEFAIVSCLEDIEG